MQVSVHHLLLAFARARTWSIQTPSNGWILLTLSNLRPIPPRSVDDSAGHNGRNLIAVQIMCVSASLALLVFLGALFVLPDVLAGDLRSLLLVDGASGSSLVLGNIDLLFRRKCFFVRQCWLVHSLFKDLDPGLAVLALEAVLAR